MVLLAATPALHSANPFSYEFGQRIRAVFTNPNPADCSFFMLDDPSIFFTVDGTLPGDKTIVAKRAGSGAVLYQLYVASDTAEAHKGLLVLFWIANNFRESQIDSFWDETEQKPLCDNGPAVLARSLP